MQVIEKDKLNEGKKFAIMLKEHELCDQLPSCEELLDKNLTMYIGTINREDDHEKTRKEIA